MDNPAPTHAQAIRKPATIDQAFVREVVGEFPHGSWKSLRGSNLSSSTEANSKARSWKCVRCLHKVGGVYAFLFPESHFLEEREISLDGPLKRSIPFRFSHKTHPAHEGYVVAYVGKATNLSQRFKLHFSRTERSTVVQVRAGLVKSGFCVDRHLALDFMLQHAVIRYRELTGDEHAANRDLLELSLCARFAPPFNIKSER